MPQFYFEYELNGDIVADEDGHELPDFPAAMLKCRQDARELAGDFLRGGATVLPEFITVLDECGRKMSSVDVRRTVLETIDQAFQRPSAHDKVKSALFGEIADVGVSRTPQDR